MTYGKDQIDWRRSQVLELSSEGYSQREIASKLQIGKGTVTNDLVYLKRQAQQNLHKYMSETDPNIVLVSTPKAPGGLMQQIELEQDSLYHKLFFDYHFGLEGP